MSSVTSPNLHRGAHYRSWSKPIQKCLDGNRDSSRIRTGICDFRAPKRGQLEIDHSRSSLYLASVVSLSSSRRITIAPTMQEDYAKARNPAWDGWCCPSLAASTGCGKLRRLAAILPIGGSQKSSRRTTTITTHLNMNEIVEPPFFHHGE